MRSLIIVLCIAAQASVLAFMVYGRENIIATGQKVTIATAPIDPRDPFRGDYVRLRYPMNNFSSAPTRWASENYEPRKGDQIYAVLKARSSGLHEVSYFTNTPPESSSSESAPYIRGRVHSNNSFAGRNGVNARFGIEQLYVQQGSGTDIEDRRGIRGGMQTAMEAEIAVGKNGTAVLVGYQWSPLGIELEVTDSFRSVAELQQAGTAPDTANGSVQSDTGTTLPPVKVTIQNLSEQTITLNNPGDNCGFRLEPALRSLSAFTESSNSCNAITEEEPHLLEPGQLLSIDVYLQASRWHVALKDNDERPPGDLRSFSDFSELFRIVYRTPQESAGAGSSDVYWQGDLVSQAFNQRGWVD